MEEGVYTTAIGVRGLGLTAAVTKKGHIGGVGAGGWQFLLPFDRKHTVDKYGKGRGGGFRD